jgi:hypothetical protein
MGFFVPGLSKEGDLVDALPFGHFGAFSLGLLIENQVTAEAQSAVIAVVMSKTPATFDDNSRDFRMGERLLHFHHFLVTELRNRSFWIIDDQTLDAALDAVSEIPWVV